VDDDGPMDEVLDIIQGNHTDEKSASTTVDQALFWGIQVVFRSPKNSGRFGLLIDA
jgi:hypothetical protein